MTSSVRCSTLGSMSVNRHMMIKRLDKKIEAKTGDLEQLARSLMKVNDILICRTGLIN